MQSLIGQTDEQRASCAVFFDDFGDMRHRIHGNAHILGIANARKEW